MTPSDAPSRSPGSALRRTAAAVLLLTGLFAMHGLPMAGAAMSTMGAATATAAATTAVHAESGRSATVVAVMAGCDGVDHCTATVRAHDAPTPPELVDTCALHVVAPALHHVVTQTVAARGPPPPDLQELCLSRT